MKGLEILEMMTVVNVVGVILLILAFAIINSPGSSDLVRDEMRHGETVRLFCKAQGFEHGESVEVCDFAGNSSSGCNLSHPEIDCANDFSHPTRYTENDYREKRIGAKK